MHEHEVPDLDITIPILIRRTWRATGDIRTVIVENLAARAARPGVTHRPEIIFFAQAPETLRIDFYFLEPNVGGFIIVLKDGNPELVSRKAQGTRQEVPTVLNRFAFEVVAKTEVAEHFEERVVASRIAHVLQIIVFTACPHTALRRCRTAVAACVLTQEHVLELHHSGVREQQRRVIARYQWSARNDLVAVITEELQKCLA